MRGVVAGEPAYTIVVVDGAGFQNPMLYGRLTGSSLDDFSRNYLSERLQRLYHQVNIDAPLKTYHKVMNAPLYYLLYLSNTPINSSIEKYLVDHWSVYNPKICLNKK